MAQLKEKREKMLEEMHTYSRPELLKREAEEKENELTRELSELEKEYKASSLAVKELNVEHERLKVSSYWSFVSLAFKTMTRLLILRSEPRNADSKLYTNDKWECSLEV